MIRNRCDQFFNENNFDVNNLLPRSKSEANRSVITSLFIEMLDSDKTKKLNLLVKAHLFDKNSFYNEMPRDVLGVVFDFFLKKDYQLQMRLIKDIFNKTEEHLGVFFTSLLKPLPKNAIKSWQCDEDGTFILNLRERYNLFFPMSEVLKGLLCLRSRISGKLEADYLKFNPGIMNWSQFENKIIAEPFFGFMYSSITWNWTDDQSPTLLGQSNNHEQNFYAVLVEEKTPATFLHKYKNGEIQTVWVNKKVHLLENCYFRT